LPSEREYLVYPTQQFTVDYLDPAKRSIGNSVQVFFKDGTQSERIAVEYPIGHRRRRKEGLPALLGKFERNLRGRVPARQADDPGALLPSREPGDNCRESLHGSALIKK
jgi:2-methylcitrate dehydratase PrpD